MSGADSDIYEWTASVFDGHTDDGMSENGFMFFYNAAKNGSIVAIDSDGAELGRIIGVRVEGVSHDGSCLKWLAFLLTEKVVTVEDADQTLAEGRCFGGLLTNHYRVVRSGGGEDTED